MSNPDDALNLYRIYASLKRGIKIIAICTGAVFALGLLYVTTTTPKYTAAASILLDRSQAETVAELSSNVRHSFENSAIESQVELIKSRRIAELALQYLYSEAEREELKQNFEERELLISTLMRNLKVQREGESNFIVLRVTDIDPKRAADRANAFAEAYIYDQINFFSDSSVKTTAWLQKKIDAQLEQSLKATQEVQKFRLENDLIDSNGRTINEQRLANMNAQLSQAKAAVATAEVRYSHSKEIIDKKDISAAVAEAFDNDVISGIRAKYLENEARLTQLIKKLGEEHNAVKNQRAVLEETRSVIFGEMKRIVQSHRNELEVAQAEAISIEKSLKDLIDKKVQGDAKKFELEALQKQADTHKALYDEYLEKYQKIGQQSSFPVAQTRIVSPAVPPLNKSHPKSKILLALSIILGGGLGVFLALLKDNFDETIRRAGQVESALGLFFLGFLPKLAATVSTGKGPKKSLFKYKAYKQAVDSPRSIHADTSRNIKLRIDKKLGKEQSKVIGVISDTPHEGKSLTASNLALHAAKTGTACLLVDADLQNPLLSRNNALQQTDNIDSTVCKNLSFKDRLICDPNTNLFILPSTPGNEITEEEMKRMIEEARNVFDYVIVDMPPLSTGSSAASIAQVIQSFLVTLEWGKTLPNQLRFHLKQSGIENESILGAVISETDMQEMEDKYSHKVYSEYVSVS